MCPVCALDMCWMAYWRMAYWRCPGWLREGDQMMVNGGGDDGVGSRCAGVRTVCAAWTHAGCALEDGVLEVCGGNAPLGCVSERWQGTTATIVNSDRSL